MTPTQCVVPLVLVIAFTACSGGRPESDGSSNVSEERAGYVLRDGEGEALGEGRLIKASPRSGTQGGVVVLDLLPPGFSTGDHIHTTADEFFYVISGTGSASLGDSVVPIGPGDFVFVPAAGTHRMSVSDEGPMELLFFLDRPGLEQFFRDAHAQYFSQNEGMTLEQCNEIGAKYDMVCVSNP